MLSIGTGSCAASRGRRSWGGIASLYLTHPATAVPLSAEARKSLALIIPVELRMTIGDSIRLGPISTRAGSIAMFVFPGRENYP